MLLSNPELQKNLKLELSPTRIIIPLMLLLLICWVGWKSSYDMSSVWNEISPNYTSAKSLFGWLSTFGYIFVIIWGSYLAASSITRELGNRTWDFVRLSPLSPAKILTGKLFGSTSVIWLLTLAVGLPVFLYCYATILPQPFHPRAEWITIILLAVTCLAWAIGSHALAIFLAMSSASQKTNRSGAFACMLPGMIGGAAIGTTVLGIFSAYTKIYPVNKNITQETAIQIGNFYMPTTPKTGSWFGMEMFASDILCMSIVFAAFWIVIGTWRNMRSAFLYKDLPLFWILFLVSTSFFMAGFPNTKTTSLVNNVMSWAFLISSVSLLICCIKEAVQIVEYKALVKNFRTKKYTEALRILPLWVVSFSLFLISGLTLAINSNASEKNVVVFLSALGLMIRDISIFHAISWNKNIRRPTLGIVIYLVFIYALLPYILKAGDLYKYLFPYVWDKMSGFRPVSSPDPFTYWIMLTIQIAVAVFIFYRKWQSAFKEKP